MIDAIKSIKIYDPYGNEYYANADKSSKEFPITDQCERSAKLMGEDYVRLQFKLYDKITFDAFSFIRYNNQTFFLREQYIPKPNGTKKEEGGGVSSTYYTYDVKFVSVANMLDKHVCYRHVKVDTKEWYEPEININGNLSTMYVIVMGAIKRVAKEYEHLYYGYLLNTLYMNGMAADGINPNTNKVRLTAGTKLLTFNFSGDKIANVCTTIANNFTNDDKKDTEWYITEEHGESLDQTTMTLHFAKCVSNEVEQTFGDYVKEDKGAYAFAHPYTTGGLKRVEYAQEWSGVTNTIVPFGSDRNMSGQSVKGIDEITNMQSTFGKRLRLDIYDKEGNPMKYKVYDLEGGEHEIEVDSRGGIRNNFVNTGIEEVKFFDDVYPQGHFRVEKVDIKNKRQDGETVPEYTITALPIDSKGNVIEKEDLAPIGSTAKGNGFYPIRIEEGTTLSVRFESGMLAGREFEIANKSHKDYDRPTYSMKFTIVADGSIEDGTLIPSGNFRPYGDLSTQTAVKAPSGVGDTFALFNMKMPDVYVEQAKQELAQKAFEELLKIQTTRPEVKCSTDPTNFNGDIALGNAINVESELFNTEGYTFRSRVISYSYKLTKTTDVQFSLASAIMQGTLSSMNDLIADVTHATGGLEQRAVNLSRRAWRDASEMAEMLDSMRTEMMLVGEEKYQFAFTSAIECNNVSNKFAGLKIGYGSLQHTQEPYISYSNNGWWEISGQTLNKDEVGQPLDSAKAYYLYAKVDDTSTPATMVLNENAYSTDVDTNTEYLLLGILSSEFEGQRVFNRTNGFSSIAGGTITTEQIQDANRQLIIDFQSKRIIANDGAEIIGNITFKSPDGGYESAESVLARLGIAESNAINANNAVAKEEKSRMDDVAKLVSDIATIQKQIDGEVSSYFYPNAPIVSETDESVRTDIEPMVEWLKNYTLTNGVYVLNANARNELINNLGDTFTNTEEYKGDQTPLAGKSWRWCDATSNPSVTKYITVQYDEDGVSVKRNLHWHIITDTDSLRALEAAKNAQATADGKCTTFLEKPKNGYNVGDLWILEDDNIHPEGKKGDILTANKESATYFESHWSKKVKYTDDTALENMEIGGRNLLRDSKVMGISQWALPEGSATYTKNADYSTITMNAEMAMNCVNTCTLQTIDKKWKDKNIVSSVMVRTTTDDNIKCGIVLRKGGSGHVAQSYYDATYITTKAGEWTKVYTTFKCSVDSEDVTIYFVVSSSKNSAIGDKYDFKEWKIEYGTKATDWSPAPEDVDAKVSALDYLKKALENDTDVIGGIVATTSIQLRDKTGEKDNAGNDIYKVNAGLSGVKDDNILLWGGGDYRDADCAAQNDYKKINGEDITTLVKKDGTGKWGVFKIKKDNVQVDTKDGIVVVDDTDGISCKNPSQEEAALIMTPKELRSLQDLKDGGRLITGNQSYYNPFQNPFSRDGSNLPTILFSDTITKKVSLPKDATLTVRGNVSIASATSKPNVLNIGSPDDSLYVRIKDSSNHTVAEGNVSEHNQKPLTYITAKTDTYSIECYCCINAEWNGIQVEQGERVDCDVYLDQSQTFLAYEYSYKEAIKQTVLAYKGLFSYGSPTAYLYYKDGVGFECCMGKVVFGISSGGVTIQGLPKKGKDDIEALPTGSLYVDGDFVKITKQ